MGIIVESRKPELRTVTIELIGDALVADAAMRQIVKTMADIVRDGISPVASHYTSINPLSGRGR